MVADIAAKLRAAKVIRSTILDILERVGSRNGKALARVLEVSGEIIRGEATRKPAAVSVGTTIQDIGEKWTSGELAQMYPDHVKAKSSADRDRQRLDRYVYPIVGATPVAAFTLEDAELVMSSLPPKRVRTPSTRRHIAQILHKLLTMAVYPLRLIKANPLPRGFMPKPGPAKAKGWLYPNEDAQLLGASVVPVPWRIFYGFLHREGCRSVTEAGALEVANVDLVRGTVGLDKNKTDGPRTWALSPGVAPALGSWLAYRRDHGEKITPRSALFIDENGERIGDAFNAARFREHLQAAGVDREELFQHSKTRMRIRLHDARATFVTLSLANGKTETWVADRTGHKSSEMINRYRRAARMAAELNLGPLRSLAELVPELVPYLPPSTERPGE